MNSVHQYIGAIFNDLNWSTMSQQESGRSTKPRLLSFYLVIQKIQTQHKQMDQMFFS